jgi:hypothetical protein
MARKAKWYHIVTEKTRVRTISRVRVLVLVRKTPMRCRRWSIALLPEVVRQAVGDGTRTRRAAGMTS